MLQSHTEGQISYQKTHRNNFLETLYLGRWWPIAEKWQDTCISQQKQRLRRIPVFCGSNFPINGHTSSKRNQSHSLYIHGSQTLGCIRITCGLAQCKSLAPVLTYLVARSPQICNWNRSPGSDAGGSQEHALRKAERSTTLKAQPQSLNIRYFYLKANFNFNWQVPPAVHACSVTKSSPTLCNPTDGSPPGSSVHGILQVRILEWVAISFSGDLPDQGSNPCLLHWQADSLLLCHLGSPYHQLCCKLN